MNERRSGAVRRQADRSGTPLPQKLGIKERSKIAVVNAPDELSLGPLPDGVQVYERASVPLDVILFFSESRSHLQRRFAPLAGFLAPSGGLWVAYPKKSSRKETDLGFQTVQQVGLAAGLVDNKSCSVDQTWTAVRFVRRVTDRA